ncbi:hypothetical protein WR25_10018 [Diploscapter pachys]|uniref:RRM domain-containing protein n=1 Tax=Diploscapter pachys TaxID=2018661 RepID=A0A2A2L737_9BILA|nr:hypothetical protein WR25_10018 [Diploscapter pachys]
MGRYTIRCEGLAYETSRDDLTSFFGGNGIIRMDIPRKSNGDAKGDATVVFDNEADFKEALNKNKQVLGRRYVEVYAEDEPRARGGGGSGGGGGRPRDAGPRRGGGGGGGGGGGADVFRHGEVAVRMTGLPYDANIRDVEHFFHPIPIVKNGVIMPKDLKENRGECFVVFPDREAGYWALKRHKNYIGKRFIDVCSASYTEVNTFCKTNGKRVPYGTNIDRERSQMTPRMMTPGMPLAPGPLMRPDPFGRDYRPGPDPFEHADPYDMARARPPMGGGPYGREPRPLMDYYSDSHEDPYYHRSGGGVPPMPLFASAGRGDPRERSPYYGREAAPMGREDSWRDEAKYDMKELGRYGNGGDYGRSPWDNEFDRRMDPYQSNGGGPIRGRRAN